MSEPSAVPVVCGLIFREGRVLVARRPQGKRLAGLWEFPGGKVEHGEEPAAALHRELMEELGCQIVITEAWPHFRHEYDWGCIDLFPFCCQLGAGSAEPFAHEHSEVDWVLPIELRQLDLAPADLPIVNHLLMPHD
jgi:8-oxo-dGTP diphosphatase